MHNNCLNMRLNFWSLETGCGIIFFALYVTYGLSSPIHSHFTLTQLPLNIPFSLTDDLGYCSQKLPARSSVSKILGNHKHYQPIYPRSKPGYDVEDP